MKYPTKEEVKSAGHEQICRWHRFLSTPRDDYELEISKLIYQKFEVFGGFTPTLSKIIGWDESK